MKLTQTDIKLLKDWGYPDEDIAQIQEAADVIKYSIDGEKIAKKIISSHLDKIHWLSGIARAAFHHTAARKITLNGNTYVVLFDASELFK